MQRFYVLSVILLSAIVSGCNTVGGFGQDVSEAGKAIDQAAYWSQSQIQEIDNEISTGSVQKQPAANAQQQQPYYNQQQYSQPQYNQQPY